MVTQDTEPPNPERVPFLMVKAVKHSLGHL